jgi:hypothetical protein
MRIAQPLQGWGSMPTDPSPEGTADLNAQSKMKSAEFLPSSGLSAMPFAFVGAEAPANSQKASGLNPHKFFTILLPRANNSVAASRSNGRVKHTAA